jgi:hypothetical protein
VTDRLVADVAAASAALMFNALSEIVKLPASEQYERLRLYIEAALIAHREAQEGWLLEPSEN